MITVPQVVEDILNNSPVLSESLEEGLVNFSSLARKLRPEIENRLLKPVTTGSVIMALKRLKVDPETANSLLAVLSKITDLSLRSNLISLTFINSPTLFENQSALLDYASKNPNSFITISNGIHETQIFISKNLLNEAEKIFAREVIKLKTENLSSITLMLPKEAINTPGVQYTVFKKLYSNGVNIYETATSYTELTIFLQPEYTERAFGVLKKLS